MLSPTGAAVRAGADPLKRTRTMPAGRGLRAWLGFRGGAAGKRTYTLVTV